MAASHRNIRLAKKAMGQPLAVIAAQNLLIRKLGLSFPDVEEVQGFERYMKMFMDVATEEQAHIIDELLMSHVPLS
jgi:hypothetical protein